MHRRATELFQETNLVYDSRGVFSPQGLHFRPWIFDVAEVCILSDVLVGHKCPFEKAINLAELPEDQNQQNRDYEQQE